MEEFRLFGIRDLNPGHIPSGVDNIVVAMTFSGQVYTCISLLYPLRGSRFRLSFV